MELASPHDDFEMVCFRDKDKPAEQQRKLKSRHLTVRQHALISDIGSEVSGKGYILNTGSSNLMCLHLGLIEMINFKDRNGKVIKLERDESASGNLPVVGYPWQENALDYIDQIDVLLFAKRIKNGEDIEEEEAKN